MTAYSPRHYRPRQRGQTLIIALLTLGVLLVLGLVFLSLIGRSIRNTNTMTSRSTANDLAESGIRYAEEQLVRGDRGADWRGEPVSLYDPADTAQTNPFSRDPDLLYIRRGARDTAGNPYSYLVGSNQPDLGGPDGLGPFVRLNFTSGRCLLRVRYAPSDANLFSASPVGALRNPRAVHNYLVIESIGRTGRIDSQDPTRVLSTTAIQFDKFASVAQYQTMLANLRNLEATQRISRPLRAFASVPLIDHARYVMNKYNISSPVQLGIPSSLGVDYGSARLGEAVTAVGSQLPLLIGNRFSTTNLDSTYTLSGAPVPGGGSVHINGDVDISGKIVLNLNRPFGEGFNASGSFMGDSDAAINLNVGDWTGSWVASSIPGLSSVAGNLDSRSDLFSTVGNLIHDGNGRSDASSIPSGVGHIVPPSIMLRDANSGSTRYENLTRESGILSGNGNSGRYGHGGGPFIDNISDRQTPEDEAGRQRVGAEQSLFDEWLNPGKSGRSSWVGPYYIPPGAYVQLLPDGFVIARNGSAPAGERTWRMPDGSVTNTTSVRYRIGQFNGQQYIINSLTAGDIDAVSPNFGGGIAFNGIIYAQGNIRVRGIIPTDVQMTIVSGASIYIEGSILKGISSNGLQVVGDFDASSGRLLRPSHSALMLMAKDYVALNTTMFFGPSSTSTPEPDSNGTTSNGYLGLLVRVGSAMSYVFDMCVNPDAATANPINPSTWTPYASTYVEMGTANKITPKLLLSHAVASGPQSPATFFNLNVNFGAFDTPGNVVSSYTFPVGMYPYAGNPLYVNTAANYLTTGPYPYGLGSETWQQYPKFESVGFDFVRPSEVVVNASRIIANGSNGLFSIFSYGLNDFSIRPTSVGGQATNDYIVARTAIMPHNIRVEASIYAEEGCFFVIPGEWANPNPNDRRDAYDASVTGYGGSLAAGDAKAAADRDRLLAFGSSPDTPFYAEPLDVKVDIIGAVSENMPPPISVQAEWLRKWGWIPNDLAATGYKIPQSHVPNYPWFTGAQPPFVPNLIVSYDPVLATGRASGYLAVGAGNDQSSYLRSDNYGRVLPPMPRLPVSPALAYFGEVQ